MNSEDNKNISGNKNNGDNGKKANQMSKGEQIAFVIMCFSLMFFFVVWIFSVIDFPLPYGVFVALQIIFGTGSLIAFFLLIRDKLKWICSPWGQKSGKNLIQGATIIREYSHYDEIKDRTAVMVTFSDGFTYHDSSIGDDRKLLESAKKNAIEDHDTMIAMETGYIIDRSKWKCLKCGTANSNIVKKCIQCGESKSDDYYGQLYLTEFVNPKKKK